MHDKQSFFGIIQGFTLRLLTFKIFIYNPFTVLGEPSFITIVETIHFLSKSNPGNSRKLCIKLFSFFIVPYRFFYTRIFSKLPFWYYIVST